MGQIKKTFNLMNLKFYKNVYLTATTNKAASVYKNAETIHSLLKLIVCPDYRTGKSTLASKLDTAALDRILDHSLIFIDECSMIDSELYKIISYIKKNKKNKIIYIGDKNQLPPVNSIFSIFNRGIRQVELDTPVRYKDKDLKYLGEILKENVESGIFNPINIPKNSSSIHWLDADSFEKEFIKYFRIFSFENRVLTYTNEAANMYAEYIRKLRGYSSLLVPNKGYVLNTPYISETRNSYFSLPSCSEIVLTDVRDIDGLTGKTSWIAQMIQQLEIENGISCDLKVVNLSSKSGTRNALAANKPLELKKIVNILKKQKKYMEMFEIKNNVLDLSQGDSLTVHKSQGSTYTNVFIDLNDLSTCRDPNVFARLLYVACTRASSKVFLCGSIPTKYGGLFIS